MVVGSCACHVLKETFAQAYVLIAIIAGV